MPVVNGEYQLRTADRISQTIDAELRRAYGTDIDLTSSSPERHIIDALAQSIVDIQEEQLQEVYRSAFLETATGQSLNQVVSILGISRHQPQQATGVVTFARSDPATTDYPIPIGTTVQTNGPEPVVFETITQATIPQDGQLATATVQAVNGGAHGNVAAGSITVMPSPIAGVESVTNPQPTGDSDLTDTRDQPLVTGVGRETDDQLRERARNTVSDGAVATRDAIYSALVNEIPDVQSVSLFVNNTYTDNRPDGLPPVSYEAVVYGGDENEIAQTIFDETALTAQPVGGYHGTQTTIPVRADNGQVYQMHFSRPIEQQLYVTVTVVVNDTYVGTAELKDIIIDYIGGVDVAGSIVFGTGVGENIYIDQLRDLTVGIGGRETGVRGIASLDITDGAGTSLIGTDGMGLSAVEIDDDTVALTNPNQITVSTRSVDPTSSSSGGSQ